jgi:hypothetical protein
MPRGGRREGAGRKPKYDTTSRQLTRYFDIEGIAAAGLTPLEVMIEAMRFFRAQAAKQQKEQKPNSKLITELLLHASDIAKDAAPYMHPRVQASDIDPLTARLGKKQIRDEEARTAGVGTEWGDIIRTPGERAN